MNRFRERLERCGAALTKRVEILQVNLGKYCNLACVHCHVEAGPTRTRENMDAATARAVLEAVDRLGVRVLDLTGGAPELHPSFRMLVQEAMRRSVHVMDRSNLTVLFEPGQEDLADFLARHRVEVIASLPCYTRENVDKQRGEGTFEASIRALQEFNRLGYGGGNGLELHLVYNPVGPQLPPPQAELERDYKERLREDFGIVFDRLYTITNVPITRYAKVLRAFKQYEGYVQLLEESFNPRTLPGLMCRNTLSVGWDGRLYDCDFNQMLGLSLTRGGREITLGDVTAQDLEGRAVLTGDHCFACAAGAGSSCCGALLP